MVNFVVWVGFDVLCYVCVSLIGGSCLMMNMMFVIGSVVLVLVVGLVFDILMFWLIVVIVVVLFGVIIVMLMLCIMLFGLVDVCGVLGIGFDEGVWINIVFIVL